MQTKCRVEAGGIEIQRMSPADYFAMKQRLIREARIAQAAAIRAALARLIAAARLNLPSHLPSLKHGD